MSATRDWTENERLLNTAIHAESYQDKIAARVKVIQQLNERERLREALRQAREFICEATWGKGPKAREAERMVLQIDLTLKPLDAALSDQNGMREG